MKTLWTAQDVAQATTGKTTGSWEATGVSIDSRTIVKGDVFVALNGDNFDGHAYVVQALEAGAVAAMVSKVPDGIDADDARLLMVVDTEKALQNLGIAGRARVNAKVIGVTGSVGKTGCKEMLRSTLGSVGNVYATSGNYNNHLGVPLTLANMPSDVEFAVIEMGMNHAGEISQLSGWAKPDVSVITTIDAVHIEFFDDVTDIARAKAEIFDGMGGQGVAILNADNEHYKLLSNLAGKKDLDRVLSFGTADDALCQMIEYGVENLSSKVDAMIAGTRVKYRLGAIGKHWGLMSVAVLAAVDAVGADLAIAAEALEHFTEPDGRGRITELKVKGGYLRLIDDAYNASPASMAAAFEKMALLRESETKPLRTVAVLGDMLELGEQSRELHVGLAPTLVNNQIDLVFAAGKLMKQMYEALPDSMRGDYDAAAVGLAPKVVDKLRADDLVLVKGSHGSRMDDVSDAIRKNAESMERTGDK